MKRTACWCALLLAAATAGARGAEEPEFARRRAAVLALLDSTSALVLRSAEPRTRNGDVDYPYRQESNLLYLTGIMHGGTALMLAPAGIPLADGSTTRAIIFLDRGAVRGFDADRDLTLLPAAEFPALWRRLCDRVRTVYASPLEPRFVNDWMNERPMFLDRDARRQLEQSFPGLKLKPAAPLISRLRQTKSAAETEAIRRAIALTGDGLRAAWKLCRDGRWEYELQAALEYAIARQGAQSTSFPSIVGSGPNALIVHYSENRRQMRQGDMVVMDVGAEIDGYAADVTRTVPVGGSFTAEQRTVYDAVLSAQRAVIGIIRPGVPWSELDRTAKASLAASGFARFLTHGVSHHLGLDVHDAGAMDTLRAGMVITVEPGAYIPANDTTVAAGFRGIGVRIEDDVLVTGEGAEVLSRAIPKERQEIERLLRQR